MKQLRVTVNGKAYDVQVEELGATSAPVAAAAPAAAPAPMSVPAPAAAPAASVAQAAGEGEAVNAPMPGNILDVKVKSGDAVKNGQPLIILEAMKMENEICAPKDGTVTAVMVNKGDTVDAGQGLVTIA